jgi:hypothetical protein
MDRDAIETAVREWLAELAEGHAGWAWLGEARLDAQPAFLVDSETREGDHYKAGAVSIVVKAALAPGSATPEQLHDAVVDDATLGNRVKRAVYERPRAEGEAGTIVVIPR